MFQFTHPGKGATLIKTSLYLRLLAFQFTHPGKGATTPPCRIDYTRAGFNSRTLGRVRLSSPAIMSLIGSFNSRTLGRVRLVRHNRLKTKILVSIHAPWEGCDRVSKSRSIRIIRFNSRTLGRVRQKSTSAVN